MKSKNCNCCYMPLNKDPKNSGSDHYCSYCYVDGKLLAEGMSLKEFQNKSYESMRKNGLNPLTAWIFTQFIRLAPYWKTRKA